VVTLRTYPNAAEAAMAKSLLDDRKILCSLADEASHLYGGAPMAMPVRLLVAEGQVEEARRILDEVGQGLPDEFDPISDNSTPEIRKSINQEVISELRELHQRHWWTTILLVAVLVLTIYLISELPRRAESPWTEVDRAMRQYDYSKALKAAKTITAEHPNDYYGHEYLGNIYLEMGDLAHAEAEYSRAYELSPPQVLQEKLRDVRKRRGTEPTPKPSLSPWP
jgi:tetratricopeptide (TPR) repeat protein